MEPEDVPLIPRALLDHLDREFPNTVPETDWSEREVWARTGARRVIDHMRAMYEEQHSNVSPSHR